mgnify:CR=1 FL=1
MSKKLDFGAEARDELLKGIDQLADAVAATLGPKGRNVVIEKGNGQFVSTKDGVSVAKEVDLPDPLQNAGVQVIKEVANQVNDEAGDGTTTATVLARMIIKAGYMHIQNNCSPIELVRGMDIGLKRVVKHLKDLSKPIKTNEEIFQVATISANNDPAIGRLISEAMDTVGTDGVVTVEESRTADDSLEVVEGMQFDRGYLSPYFITNQQEMLVQMEDPHILLYDGKISNLKPLVKILEFCISKSKPLFIVAEDIDGEALAGLIVNKARGTLNVAAVKAPGFGDKRSHNLEDIAVLTGANVISPKKGLKLEKVTADDFGSAKNISVSSKWTTIVDGAGTQDGIKSRIEEIKTLIESADSAYEVEGLQERLGKLAGGVAVLKIGAQSELELNEKKDRVEDALAATRAAVDEGIVPGGGCALMRAQNKLMGGDAEEIEFLNHDQKNGYDIIVKACFAPFDTICENAGLVPQMIWNNVALDQDTLKVNPAIGYNILTGKIVNLAKEGIIDPTRVTRTALEKAVSVAGTLLLTECVITKTPDDKKDELPAGGFGLM